MYQVLARTWRPRSFDELIGQPHVARTLSNAIAANRVAHAYIFAGLRGTGKTTVARIMAKCLNCTSGPTAAPCGECEACSEITDGRAMDVMELDAASRTGVGDIRELQEVISYAPVRDRYKVLIIDEAHMLSKPAFNALLKTLEEPPPNVIFILATTELQKILPTILSRCQVFEFRRVTAGELVGHLRRICDEESIELSDAALDRIARAGEGSVRDSLSVLERVVAFCGKQAGDDDVMRVLGAVHGRVLVELVGRLAAHDAAGMLRVLDALVDEGHDLVHFWSQLIAALRDLQMLSALPDRPELLARPADEAAALAEAAEGLGREDLTRAFQLLADLEPRLRSSSQPRYMFEACLIRLAALGAVRPIEQVLAELGGAPSNSSAAPRAPRVAQKKKTADPAAPARSVPATRPPASAARADRPAPPSAAPGRGSDLVDAVTQARPMLGAILSQAVSLEHRDDRLTITLPAARRALTRQLEQKESLSLLADHAEAVFGARPEIEILTADAEPAAAKAAPAPRPAAAPSPPPPTAIEEPVPHPAAAEAEPAPEPATAPPDRSRARRAEATKAVAASTPSAIEAVAERARAEPGIQQLLDRFGARIVDARPDEGTPGPGHHEPTMEDTP